MSDVIDEITTGAEDAPSVEVESSEAEDVSAEDKQETEAENTEQESELNEFTDASREEMQKRIDIVTARAARKQEKLERELAELRAKVNQPQDAKPNMDGAPNEDDFDDISDYYKELGKWEAQQAFKQEQAKQEQAKSVQEYQARMQEAETKFNEQAKELYTERPEAKQVLDDLVQDWEFVEGDPMTKQAIVDVMMQAENIPALMLEIADNVNELAKLSPLQAAMKLGEMQAGLKGAPKKTVQPKPKPISSLKGTGKVDKSIDEMSDEEFRKKFLKQ